MVASFLWNDPFGQLCCVFESLELAVFVKWPGGIPQKGELLRGRW